MPNAIKTPAGRKKSVRPSGQRTATTSAPSKVPALPKQESPASAIGATLKRLLTGGEGHDSLVVAIAYELGLDIIEGRFKPGDCLNTVDLARRFKTSRTPVREALSLLEKQSLADISPRRRARVHAASPQEVGNIYDLRAAMHALVAELVAIRASEDDLARLRERLQTMREVALAKDVNGYFTANMAFHETATEVCRNPFLKRSIESLGLITYQLRHETLSDLGRIQHSLEDHIQLMRAFEDRNPTLAATLIRSNILRAVKILQEKSLAASEAAATSASKRSA